MGRRPAAYSEVVSYWRGVKSTLRQRGLLQTKRQEDGTRAVILPQAQAIVAPDWVAFVLDMHRLGGVSRERWLDRDLHLQIRATLQGRRVFVADSAGLALVVAREPGTHARRLPTSIVMTPDRTPPGDYTALLGESASGDVLLDLSEGERAILVGGTSGSGKTRSIISLVLQLAHKNGPDRLALAMVDLKRLDFTALDALPHLVRPTATTEAEAGDLVEWCVQEMERRQAVMQAASVTRWDRMEAADRFPLLLVVVDEVADFADSGVMADLVKLARKGRASGVSLILATQRPDAQVLSRQVKANLTARVAFRVTDIYESKIILDRTGAEQIKRRGLCLTNAGGGKWRKVQAAYVPDDQVGEWVTVTPNAGPVLSEIERALVAYAIRELDGAFVTNRLYDAQERGDLATEERMSQYALKRLAQGWERRGWLTEPGHDSNGHKVGRLVAPELAGLALVRPGTLKNALVRPGTDGTMVRNSAPGVGVDVELPTFLTTREVIACAGG